jgi:hypothetical protein
MPRTTRSSGRAFNGDRDLDFVDRGIRVIEVYVLVMPTRM